MTRSVPAPSRLFRLGSIVQLSVIAVTLAIHTCILSKTARASDLPVNPQVSPDQIATTICSPGWTRTIRPLVPTMRAIKREMLTAIGKPFEHRNRYALDHRIPLVFGGDPIDRQNSPSGQSRSPEKRTPLRSVSRKWSALAQ